MSPPRVLIAAPTAECKDYALEKYVEAIHELRWRGETHLLLVDNSPDKGYGQRLLAAGVDEVCHIKQGDNLLETVDLAWDIITARAHEGHWDYLYSVESDVIVAPESLELLYDAMERYGACLVRHAYPVRGAIGGGRTYQALGCMLLRMHSFPYGCHRKVTGERWEHTETALIKWALSTGDPVVEFNHLFEVRHLSEDGDVHERNVPTQVVKLG